MEGQEARIIANEVTRNNPATCAECGGALLKSGDCPRCLLSLASPGFGDGAVRAGDERGEVPSSSEGQSSRRFGDYELLEEIARGGMGVVYRARQVSLDRLVVLKMVQGGLLASKKLIDRFHHEARAMSNLAHSNIVPIYDIGELEGVHFFTMKFFERGTLADGMRRFQLAGDQGTDTRFRRECAKKQSQVAGIIATVARAVQFAHSHGVIHRDLKPSNILLDEEGEAHVGDFGLAKLLNDDAELTLSGDVLGTPSYMSPEQARGGGKSLTVTTDVYGLGAILYHLISGQAPFSGTSSTDILRKVEEDEPESLRRLVPQLAPDLETICLRCLNKDTGARYQTALDVAEELDRFQRNEPIHARPIKPWQRMVRWCQRKPALAILIGLLGMVGLVGIAGITLQRNAAVEANLRLGDSLQHMDSQLIDSYVGAGRVIDGLQLLVNRLQENPENHVALQRTLSLLETQTIPLPAAAPIHVGPWARHAFFGPNENRLAIIAGSADSEKGIVPSFEWRGFDPPGAPETLRLWDREKGQLLERGGSHAGRIHDVHFHPDASLIATASWDGSAKVWNCDDMRLVSELRHEAPVWAARFSPNRRHLITVSCNMVDLDVLSVWDTESWARLQRTPVHLGNMRFANFSPNGNMLVLGHTIWAMNDEHQFERVQELLDPHRGKGSEVGFGSGMFTADNRHVLVISRDRFSQVFDVLTGKAISRTKGHASDIIQGQMSPSGALFVTAAMDGIAQIWMTKTGEPASSELKHSDAILEACFSPKGAKVATASADGKVGVWDAFTGEPFTRITIGYRPVMGVQFYDQGHKLVATSNDGWISFWDVQSGIAWPEELERGSELEESTSNVSVSGRRLFIKRTVEEAKFRDGTIRESDRIHISEGVTNKVTFSEVLHSKPIHSIQLDPTGRRLLTASKDGTARVWDSETFNPLSPPLLHDGPVFRARFSHDGGRIVTASEDGHARIWDTASGLMLTEPLAHGAPVVDARFSEDDRWVSVGSRDGSARVWGSDTGEPLTPFLKHESGILMTRILPDHERIVVGTEDSKLRIWDIKHALPLTESVPMPFQPTRLILSRSDETARLGGKTKDRFENMSLSGYRFQLRLKKVPSNPPKWFVELLKDVADSQTLGQGRLLPEVWKGIWEQKEDRGKGEDFYNRWGHWFLSDRTLRSINPSAEESLTAFVRRRIGRHLYFHVEYRGSPDLARYVANAAVDEGDLFLHWAGCLEAIPGQERTRYLLAQHATSLAPHEAKSWQALAKYALGYERFEESLSAVEQAYRIDPAAPRLRATMNRALFESRKLILEASNREMSVSGPAIERLGDLIDRSNPGQDVNLSGPKTSR